MQHMLQKTHVLMTPYAGHIATIDARNKARRAANIT
jgi:hypothetical protein